MSDHAPNATVCTPDCPSNALVKEVIGNKTDVASAAVGTASIMALARQVHQCVEVIYEAISGVIRILPDLSPAVVVTADPAPWTYGVETVIGTPTGDYSIAWIDLVANNNDAYQIRILRGGVEVGDFTFERFTAVSRSIKEALLTSQGSGQLTAKLASALGGSTCSIKVGII